MGPINEKPADSTSAGLKTVTFYLCAQNLAPAFSRAPPPIAAKVLNTNGHDPDSHFNKGTTQRRPMQILYTHHPKNGNKQYSSFHQKPKWLKNV